MMHLFRRDTPQTADFPETWDEMSEADLAAMLQLRARLSSDPSRPLTVADVRRQAVRLLLDLRGIGLEMSRPEYLLLVARLADKLDWLWTEREKGVALEWRSTLNLLPTLRRWRGPLSHGADLVLGEFRTAVALMQEYEADPSNLAPLQRLAGLLYRLPATRQQREQEQLLRRPYDHDGPTQWLRRGEAMKDWQVWGVYAWTSYFCEYLATGTFIIDGNEVCFAPLFKPSTGEGSSSSAAASLTQIALTMAETHVFGTLRQVEHTPLLTVMQKLLYDYEAACRLKKSNGATN